VSGPRSPPGEAVAHQARTWRWISSAGRDQSISAYSGSKNPAYVLSSSRCASPRLARLDARDRSREQPHEQTEHPPEELVRPVDVVDPRRPLREQRAGVEVVVHAVDAVGELGLAVSQRPGDRVRPAQARQRPGVRVDRPEPRHGERVRGDPDGEAGAEREVWLQRGEQRREPVRAGSDEHVEVARHAVDEPADVLFGAVPAGRTGRGDDADGLVPERAKLPVEEDGDLRQPGDQRDAHRADGTARRTG
jgi:hypothetical protein